jgi:hypothetical protein
MAVCGNDEEKVVSFVMFDLIWDAVRRSGYFWFGLLRGTLNESKSCIAGMMLLGRLQGRPHGCDEVIM